MKKVVTVLFALFLACSALFACKKDSVKELSESDEYVVLVPESEYVGGKFADYMAAYAEENDEFTFVAYDGFVSSINGIENSYETNYYWMLYTNDADNSNPAWGKIKYKGEVFCSAAVGINDLSVVEGKTYIWVYSLYSA